MINCRYLATAETDLFTRIECELSLFKLLIKFLFLSLCSFTEMAEGNGELVEEMANQKMEGAGDGERTEDYTKLLEYGLDKKVSSGDVTIDLDGSKSIGHR